MSAGLTVRYSAVCCIECILQKAGTVVYSRSTFPSLSSPPLPLPLPYPMAIADSITCRDIDTTARIFLKIQQPASGHFIFIFLSISISICSYTPLRGILSALINDQLYLTVVLFKSVIRRLTLPSRKVRSDRRLVTSCSCFIILFSA
jgi:hypothetical protein